MSVYPSKMCVCISLGMGPHHPGTYKSMSLVPPFGDVGAHVQYAMYRYHVQKCLVYPLVNNVCYNNLANENSEPKQTAREVPMQ